MLADYVVETREVKGPGGSFTLRPVTFETLSQLIAGGFREELTEAIQLMAPLLENSADVDLALVLHQIVPKVPNLTARLIAISAGESEHWEIVRSMPISLQLDAMLKIGDLTFMGDYSIKNFIGGLTTLLTGMTSTVDEAMKIAGPIGTRVSDGASPSSEPRDMSELSDTH